MKIYRCVVCGWIYDEASGVLDEGISAGTAGAEVPDDWRCPECNVGDVGDVGDVGKGDFVLREV